MRVVIFLGLLVPASLCAAQGSWLYQYPVTFDSLGEQTWVVLGDGNEIELKYGDPGRLSFHDVKQWTKGEQLSIAYSSEDGEVLVDPKSSHWIPIAHGPEKHSIDLIKEACLEVELTTPGMAGCYLEALGLWELEIQRCYRRLEASLDPEQKAKVEEAQRQWLAFRAAETAAIGAIYIEGTISQIHRASAVADLVKQRARDLQTMIQGGT